MILTGNSMPGPASNRRITEMKERTQFARAQRHRLIPNPM